MLCYAMLCYAMLCYALLCCAVLCCPVLCWAGLCWAVLGCAGLCWAVLGCVALALGDTVQEAIGECVDTDGALQRWQPLTFAELTVWDPSKHVPKKGEGDEAGAEAQTAVALLTGL